MRLTKHDFQPGRPQKTPTKKYTPNTTPLTMTSMSLVFFHHMALLRAVDLFLKANDA